MKIKSVCQKVSTAFVPVRGFLFVCGRFVMLVIVMNLLNKNMVLVLLCGLLCMVLFCSPVTGFNE
jgi:hypothetical protein